MVSSILPTMNLVLILVIVGFFWIKLRTRDNPLNQIENRIQTDLIRLQIEPSRLLQEGQCPDSESFLATYVAELKRCLWQGQALGPGLESLARVIFSVNQVQRKVASMRETLLVKLAFQVLTMILVRLFLGDFWLSRWIDLALILLLAISLAGLWLVFERLLPQAILASLEKFQWWLALLMSAGERHSESCPGMPEMLRLEKKNGIGRRDARMERVVQHLQEICRHNELACERFGETMVVFELLAGGLMIGCLLIPPIAQVLQGI